VSPRDIELFTELTGDRNPMHYDEQLATASRFGGIIVQGGVTSACSTRSSPRTVVRLCTTITTAEGVVELTGDAHVYRVPLGH
jgi:hypothetical protein